MAVNVWKQRNHNYSVIRIIILFTALMALFSTTLMAQPLDNGIAYINTTVNVDDNWGSTGDITYNYHSTYEVIEAYKSLGFTNQPYAAGLNWLKQQGMLSADHVARRVLAFDGVSSVSDIEYLQQKAYELNQYYKQPSSQIVIIDVALTILALKSAGVTNRVEINSALNYLIVNQNPDGGWGVYPGDRSSVYMTTVVMETLTAYLAQGPIPAATAYLMSKKNADGGFGDNADSTVWETALTYLRLAPLMADDPALAAADAYIGGLQMANGSWNDDPYETALALRALHLAANPKENPFLASLKAQVVDAQTDQPLSGVSISLTGPTPDAMITGANGDIMFKNLQPGEYYIQLSLAGYATMTLFAVTQPGAINDLGVIKMLGTIDTTTGIVMGVVTDADTGQALPGATVTVSGVLMATETRSGGEYQVVNVAAGSVSVTVFMAGYTSATATGTITAGGVFVFSPYLTRSQTAILQGTVTDGVTGTALPGVTIDVAGTMSATATTDSGGGYQVNNLVAGNNSVTATLAGYETVSSIVILADTGVFTFSPKMYPTGTTPPNANTSGFSGVTMDAGTNQLLEGVNIEVTILGQTHVHSSGAGGVFEVTGLSGSQADLRFTLAGYQPITITIMLEYAQTLDLGQVRMRKLDVVKLMPDLVVEKVNRVNAPTDPHTLYVAGQVTVDVVNRGTSANTNPVKVTFFHDANLNGVLDAGDKTLGETFTAGGLAVDVAETVFAMVEGVVPFRDAAISVFVDSSKSVSELDETNNYAVSSETCMGMEASKPYDPVVKWHWQGSPDYPEYKNVLTNPVVGQLSDDNNDGKIDNKDIPDLVFTAYKGTDFSRGVLQAVSGDDGHTIWSVQDGYYTRFGGAVNPAIGDIDGDGIVEIVINDFARRNIFAFEHDGTLKWQQKISQTTFWINFAGINIADLDHDGTPEIIFMDRVYDNNGNLLWIGPEGIYTSGSSSCVADVDLDGFMEVVTGATLYSHNGETIWSLNNHWPSTIPVNGYTAVGNFDIDDYAEIVYVSKTKLYLFEHTGDIKWGPIYFPGGGWGGSPVVADVDGDGEPEIGIAGSTKYMVFETDGSIKWISERVYDYAGEMTGSSSFDFDHDGKAEILYTDERFLYIFDGISGETLVKIPNESRTHAEYSVVADIDNDGHAEVLVNSSKLYDGSVVGMRAFEAVNDDWAPTRSIWNQYQYHITNVNDDGTIPVNEEHSWLTHNSYRVNAFMDKSKYATSKPDLTASLLRIIDNGAGQSLSLSLRVGNGGVADSKDGTQVSFYLGDPASGGVLLGSLNLGVITAGSYTDIRLNGISVLPSGGQVFAVVDPAGLTTDCNIHNNSVSVSTDTFTTLGVISVSTDATQYGANNDVAISVIVTNTGAIPGNFTAELLIEDSNGAQVAVVSSHPVVAIPGGGVVNISNVWNTGTYFAGTYRLKGVLHDHNGIIVSESVAAFGIVIDKSLSSGIVTDKIEYGTGEMVRITSQVYNPGANSMFTDLTASLIILNTAGQQFYSTSWPVQMVGAGARVSSNSFWNAGLSPAGSYMAILSVASADGHILTTSQATFGITSSADTGAGLIGTLKAADAEVFRGMPENFNYTADNKGNANLAMVDIILIIADPDSGQAVLTQEIGSGVTIGQGQTFIGAYSLPTIDLEPRMYLAILQAKVGAATVALASDAFKVLKPRVETTMTIPDYARVLVWVNDGCLPGSKKAGGPNNASQTCIDRDVVTSALDMIGVTYRIVQGKKDFQVELRNNFYTDYLILGDFNPLESKFGEELLERVASGKGIITSPWIGDRETKEIFNIKPTGSTGDISPSIEIIQSQVFSQQSFPAYYKGRHIEYGGNQQNILGWITTPKGQTLPAIIKEEYAGGKGLYFAFDLGLSATPANFESFTGLLANSLAYVHTPQKTAGFAPNDIVPVRIEVKSMDIPVDTMISATFPAGYEIYDVQTGLLLETNPAIWEMSLDAQQTMYIDLIVHIPDSAGSFMIDTETSVVFSGQWITVNTAVIELSIPRDSLAIVGDIVAGLRSLSGLSGVEGSSVNEALLLLAGVNSKLVQGKYITEEMIQDILKAIGRLNKITTIDMAAIRNDTDTLLSVMEGQWYKEYRP